MTIEPPHEHWREGGTVSSALRNCTTCMGELVRYVMRQNDVLSVYNLTVRMFRDAGAGSVFRRGDGIYDVIRSAFEAEVTIHRFGFNQWNLNDDGLVTAALNWLEAQAIERGYSIQSGPDVWYGITRNLISECRDDPNCGITLAGLFQSRFSNSIYNAARFLHPTYPFAALRFRRAPAGTQRNDYQVRLVVEEFEMENEIQTPSDWYAISSDDVDSSDLSSVFNTRFCASMTSLVRFIYPDFNIQPWRFSNVPTHYWSSPREQHAFLSSLIAEAELDNPIQLLQTESLFNESFEHLARRIGGSGGLVVPEQSGFNFLFDLVAINFPNHEIYPWFQSRCHNFWTFIGNIRWYLEWLFSRLEIRLDDRDTMTLVDSLTIRANYGRGLLNEMPYADAVMAAFPELGPWEPTMFDREVMGIYRPTRQSMLYHHLTEIFPAELIEYNYNHPEIINPATRRRLELDIFLPELRIAFEYSPASTHTDSEVQLRDDIKRNRCVELGIQLFVLDENWDGGIDTVRALLRQSGFNV